MVPEGGADDQIVDAIAIDIARRGDRVAAAIADGNAVEREVRVAITAFESRVELLEVRAEQDPADDRRVVVAIGYRVVRSNTRDSLVFPYYLPRAEGP